MIQPNRRTFTVPTCLCCGAHNCCVLFQAVQGRSEEMPLSFIDSSAGPKRHGTVWTEKAVGQKPTCHWDVRSLQSIFNRRQTVGPHDYHCSDCFRKQETHPPLSGCSPNIARRHSVATICSRCMVNGLNCGDAKLSILFHALIVHGDNRLSKQSLAINMKLWRLTLCSIDNA